MTKVLIVDDNALNRKLALTVLELGGYSTLQAHNAEAGLALARSEQPDAILMDIQMADMDGLEATRILKSDPATSQIKVIALTALAMKGDKERILAAGCDGYLSKPLDYKALWASLKKLIP